MNKKPKFEDTLDLPEPTSLAAKKPAFEETVDVPEERSTFQKALNVMDIPFSLASTAAEAALNPERDVIPAVTEQVKRTIESPTTAAELAPRGTDINKQLKQQLFGEAQETGSLPEKVAGFTTEVALGGLISPVSWFSLSKPAKKAIRKPLLNASERQAAKAVSQYATRGAVLKEGAEIEGIGARLVAEDLQGLLRDPKSLYEKISGTRHLTKVLPESLDTLQIKRAATKKGLISEVSESITDTIKKLEDAEGLKPIVPANVMGKQLLQKMKVNLSKTSGETLDLNQIESVLQRALKPFERKAVPVPPKQAITTQEAMIRGITSDKALKEIKKAKFTEGGISPLQFEGEEIAKSLKLSEIHELRKNVGKLVADRAFYAAPDQAMKAETEVLRDLYRELGDVIKTQLAGKKINVGTSLVDAGEFYQAQNNRLKSMLDLQSMLEYVPTEQLKDPDMAAKIAGMAAQAGIWGTGGMAAAVAGLPVSPVASGILGATMGAGQAAGKIAQEAAPEYLTSLFKQAAKVAPAIPGATTQGTITMLREGKFDPTTTAELNQPQQPAYDFTKVKPAFEFGGDRTPQGFQDVSPIVKMKLPRSSSDWIKNKDMVLQKMASAGVPPEMIDSAFEAMNEDHGKLEGLVSTIAMSFPELFVSSKYNMINGRILDPNERAKAADDTSKRDDLGSLQKAKIIRELNKSGKWLGE